MNILGVVGARLNSSRLPRKHLLDLAGQPLIARLFQRLELIPELTSLVLATTHDDYNRPLVDWAKATNREVFAYPGNVNDLMGRVNEIVNSKEADIVVYFCGDSPLIEPPTISRLINELVINSSTDYPRLETLPQNRGYIHEGFTIFRRNLWDRMMAAITTPEEREHVGAVLDTKPNIERNISYVSEDPVYSRICHRISVDTPADYHFMGEIYNRWFETHEATTIVSLEWAVQEIIRDTNLRQLNSHVRQKKIDDLSKSVLIYTQANKTIGIGHLRRMLHLATALREHYSYGVHIAIEGDPIEIIGLQEVNHTWLSNSLPVVPQLESIYVKQKPNVVILDWKYYSNPIQLKEWLKGLGENKTARIAIDGLFDFDSVIDHFHIPSFHCSTVTSESLRSKLSHGWDNYLLPASHANKPSLSAPNRLLVMTGGSDPSGLARTLPGHIDKHFSDKELRVSWIQGPYAKPPLIPDDTPHKWTVSHNPNNLSEIVSHCDFAITVYGLTFFELLKSGIPCITFDPHGAATSEEWSLLQKENVAILTENAKEAARKLKLIINDWELSREMGDKAAEMLSSGGAAKLHSWISSFDH